MHAFTLGEIAWAAISILIAYFCRGVAGFGTGLIATPLLAMALPMRVVVPLNTLLVLVVLVFLSIRDRRCVVWEELRRLIGPTVVGVIAGLLVFRSLNNHALLALLGGFIVVYAIYTLIVHAYGLPSFTCSGAWAIPAALAGSFIDMMFGGGGGPIVVIYLHARGVSGRPFRVTVGMLWLVEGIARATAYSMVGFYTKDVLLLAAGLLLFVVAGNWMGEHVGDRIRPETFSKVLAVLLLVAGMKLLFL